MAKQLCFYSMLSWLRWFNVGFVGQVNGLSCQIYCRPLNNADKRQKNSLLLKQSNQLIANFTP